MSVSFFTSRTATVLPPRSRSSQTGDSASRRRVTQGDLDLFRALVGGPPQRLEAVKRNKHLDRAPDAPDERIELIEADAPELPAASHAEPARPKRSGRAMKQSVVLWADRAERVCQRIAVRVRRPLIAVWVRHLSHRARERFSEAKVRLTSAH